MAARLHRTCFSFRNPGIAHATVYARAGQMIEARNVATHAQSMGYAPASQLLQQLSQ